MNTAANAIKQRLSLRKPLQESLDVVVKLAEILPLRKSGETDASQKALPDLLAQVQNLYPQVRHFERDFPSLAFSIATGVGKTRLMGACVAYLALHKGVKNFFILAPNLTIYEKLIKDFGDPASAKYVFKGIGEFVQNRPVIITGDNYAQQGSLFDEKEVRINIFNISKFNAESKGSRKGGVATAPRIKRLSEYLGQSYWEYLSTRQDLVILMDEAHRYHADASHAAINELSPVLGLELTATPTDEKGKAFQNIVYEYNLAQALADGAFVKSPAIAKRKNFEKGQQSEEEIDRIKLEDAVSIHRQTQTELERYARDTGARPVKPFILVVCKNIEHAEQTYAYINSTAFYEGAYIGKALQIHSVTRKDDEVESLFVSLEFPDNAIEIVLHVNMLKEGWDVSNLYTIVPLRAANAKILIEQTIGRGLRLPYDGKRTGVAAVDQLTVIAHDNFNQIIKEAQNPDSLLNKFTFIELEEDQLGAKTEVVTAPSLPEKAIQEEAKAAEKIADPAARRQAQAIVDAKKAILDVLPTLNNSPEVRNLGDLQKESVKQQVIQKVTENLSTGQLNVFAPQIVAEVVTQYDTVISSFREQVIPIPRMVLAPGEVEAYFEDFDLLLQGFDYQALEQQIIRMDLQSRAVETIGVIDSGIRVNPVHTIVNELLSYDDIDYDVNADLLYKLANQAFTAINSHSGTEEKAVLAVRQYKKAIAAKIYAQMQPHFIVRQMGFSTPDVLPFTRIESHNYSVLTEGGYRDYREVISPASAVPRYLFRGFEKACHFEYKFDSNTEKELAFVLESDSGVLRWLRPARDQFRIYWGTAGRRYEPDFVVETEDYIYILEPKRRDQLHSEEVQLKAAAGRKYCSSASEYNSAHGGKRWQYVLIPDDAISQTVSLDFLLAQYTESSM